jgi:uncharacterized protein (DUF1684 family)
MALGIAVDRVNFQGLHFTETSTGLRVSARMVATNAAGDEKLVDASGLPTGLTPAQQATVRTLVRKLIGAYALQVLGTDTSTKRLDLTKDGMITEVDKAAPAVDPSSAPPDQFA